METLAAAAGIGLLTWLGFIFWENRRRPQTEAANGKAKQLGSRGTDYSRYHMSGKEMAGSLAAAAFFLGMVGYVFYRSGFAAMLLAALAVFYPRLRRKALIRKRQEELSQQFKQALYSLSSSLSAGKSVENAFADATRDLQLLYGDKNTDILLEFERIHLKIRNGETVESALFEFSGRTGLDDVRQFADVFAICKRSGGNLVEVMRKTAQVLGEKLDIQQEISVMVAQKRFESKVLGLAPIVVVGLLAYSSPDYMAPLYDGAAGRLIMTGSLALLSACWGWTKHIMEIRV